MTRRGTSSVATLADVAKEAGVSMSTVSRVLSRPDAVAATTRRKVLRAVTSLRYATNAAAKHLRTRRSEKLLVIVPDLSNPFYPPVLQSIEETAHHEGYAVVLGDTQQNPAREERYALMLRRREAEGLIVLGYGLPGAAVSLSEELQTIAPIVSGYEFKSHGGISSVHIDNQLAAGDAMDHLYTLGHRRIALVTGPASNALSGDRLTGAMARAAAAGLAEMVTTAHGDFTVESGEAAATRLLSDGDRPTALFCFNDQMAIGAMGIARRLGIKIPEQLSVIGIDDIAFARYTVPSLTTIAQPVKKIGQETVRVVLAIIRGQAVTSVSIVVPHRLMIRASTGPSPS